MQKYLKDKSIHNCHLHIHTSHNGNKIPLKNAAGLNKDFFKAYKAKHIKCLNIVSSWQGLISLCQKFIIMYPLEVEN